MYDSTKDTLEHIQKVTAYLDICAGILRHRGVIHDASKLRSPEKEAFDKYTPKLAKLTYGTDEYREALRQMKPAIEHHYKENSHHPEHYENGVDDMSLFDIIEMLMDWKAASERHEDDDIIRSLEINEKRFDLSPQLASILMNTVKELDW